jgi:plastocyanin
MKSSFVRNAVIAGAALAAAVAIAATTVPSGPNKIMFPAGYDTGVLYATVDRYDVKQYREFYASADSVKAAREGRPLPYGTTLTLVPYKAKADANGNPIKDAGGHFIKDELVGIFVMEKRQGWGADIPADIRNGEWEYQVFTPEGKVNDKANLTACYECHKPFANDDYLTNLAKLAGKFPSAATVMAKTGANDVAISGFMFGPARVAVAAGQAVTWTNADDSPHQVAVAGKNTRSGVMLRGQSQSIKFDEAGMFPYTCGLHPGMKGTIEVVKN